MGGGGVPISRLHRRGRDVVAIANALLDGVKAAHRFPRWDRRDEPRRLWCSYLCTQRFRWDLPRSRQDHLLLSNQRFYTRIRAPADRVATFDSAQVRDFIAKNYGQSNVLVHNRRISGKDLYEIVVSEEWAQTLCIPQFLHLFIFFLKVRKAWPNSRKEMLDLFFFTDLHGDQYRLLEVSLQYHSKDVGQLIAAGKS